jgi:predicted GNAT superfamily acetyltransferase
LTGDRDVSLHIRTVTPDDYAPVIRVLDEWWEGRAMTAMLPKLFFVHFRETSFIAEEDGDMIGFLIGFLSPAITNEAYIHFIGAHPEHRKSGVARTLYEHFFQMATEAGRHWVRCVTSPVNASSIAFHRAMGFDPEQGAWADGAVPIERDYDGPGEDRVLLVRKL